MQEQKQVNFRIDLDLINWLKEYAKDNRRTVTAQLAIIIEQEKERVTKR